MEPPCYYCASVRLVTSCTLFAMAGKQWREIVVDHCPICRPPPKGTRLQYTTKTEAL